MEKKITTINNTIHQFSSILIVIILIFFAALISSEIKAAFLQYIHTVILGILGLTILHIDMQKKQNIMKQELDFKKKIYEDQKGYIAEELKIIKPISVTIASAIIKHLQTDTNWASDALEKAKLGLKNPTLFADRLTHFRSEKEFLANQFVPLLLKRCKNIILESNQKIYIILDSGTTIYPFFKKLADELIRYSENGETWLKNIEFVTNNLPGIDIFMNDARVNPNSRYSELVVKCHLLPGVPMPIYSAVAGRETNLALKRLKEESAGENPLFIGLVTGNWVRVRRSEPRCPLPLARGDGHLDFKQEIFDYCNEIYVISPLGKITRDVPPNRVNEVLEYTNENDLDRKPYNEIKIEEKAKVVKLVSTSRSNGYLLSAHSNWLCGYLNIDCNFLNNNLFINSRIDDCPHLVFRYEFRKDEKETELEFPHKHQRSRVMKELFNID